MPPLPGHQNRYRLWLDHLWTQLPNLTEIESGRMINFSYGKLLKYFHMIKSQPMHWIRQKPGPHDCQLPIWHFLFCISHSLLLWAEGNTGRCHRKNNATVVSKELLLLRMNQSYSYRECNWPLKLFFFQSFEHRNLWNLSWIPQPPVQG